MIRWALAALLAAPVAAGEPRFVERAAALGIDHRYTGEWEHYVGGGVAAFDCDGDDLPELYAAGGSSAAALLRNRSTPGGELVLAAETPPALALTGATGAYPLDVDGDGALDLAVLRVGENVLLRGDGACGFAPFSDLGFEGGDRWTAAFSATWEPGAALPTLAFGNYVDRDDPDGPFEACDANELHRPEDAAYGAPLLLEPGLCALSMLFTDWGRRGRRDLRVSNDRHYYVRGGGEQMWAMEALPRLMGEADGWRELSIWGMGIAARDLDHDGLAEVYLTSMADQILQSLEPGASGPSYAAELFERGHTAHRPHTGDDGRPSTGWHAAFGDVDNDGRDDLFVAKGNVDQMASNAMEDPNSLLMQGADGRFVEASVAAGVASPARSRGAALVDLNLDGRLDLAVVNRRAPMEIYQNATEGGAWLAVEPAQPGPNAAALGAWIEVEAGGVVRAQEVVVGGGHAGGVAGPL
ncbi:MAG: VCBS repeat-containing protein, partial [Pseudomonadota bacterium]